MYQICKSWWDREQKARANRAQRAALRFTWAAERLFLILRKAYDPDQPRVPAGSPEGGQWTDDGSGLSRAPVSFREQLAQALGTDENQSNRRQVDDKENEAQSKRDAVANWAENRIKNQDYQYRDSNPLAGGWRNRNLLHGRFSPKCNIFVGDALAAAGINVMDVRTGLYPGAKEWGDPNRAITGFRVLGPKERPQRGDIVADGHHMGIYSPGENGEDKTISAADEWHENKVVHNRWGFRGNEEGPVIFRRYVGTL